MPKASSAVLANLESSRIVDVAQDLTNSLQQLRAMLIVIYGESGGAFRRLSNEIQESYIWGCADKAEACAIQAEELTRRLMKGGGK